MRTLIKGGSIINEGKHFAADILIEDDTIKAIMPRTDTACSTDATCNTATLNNADDCINADGCINADRIINADGCIVLPGVIDTHVHFREPGLTHKANMETESRAAAYGGVTSVFEMPNTKPQTTSAEALADKLDMARSKMHVNYAFFPGATNDNVEFLRSLDPHTVPGIKLFMGSSTGGMLVDGGQALEDIFALAHDMQLPLMAHCEDTQTINDNMARIKAEQNTDDPDVTLHPEIRSREACIKSSALAIQLAQKHQTRLHIAHISTKEEVEMLRQAADSQSAGTPLVTGEATVAHLVFTDADYLTLGSRIKCNPAIKGREDRDALRRAIAAPSQICTIGTDHAPHAINEKQGGAAKAMSGMPSVQYSLPAILELTEQGILPIERVPELMSHTPATLFSVSKRGFLREGYKADIAIVKHSDTPWTVTPDGIQSLCKWSPMEGMTFHWQIKQTIVSGQTIYDDGTFHSDVHGQRLSFRQ